MKVDPKLIDYCLAGDQLKLKELYHLLLPYLRAVCSRYIRNRDLIRDVLQESFIDIFNNLHTYDSQKGDFHKWAVKITINATIKYNQRVDVGRQIEFRISNHDVTQPPEALENMSDEVLLKVLNKLPEGIRAVFNLYVIDGYSHKEIAETLDITVENSRKKLSRAKNNLRTYFRRDPSQKGFNPFQIFLN